MTRKLIASLALGLGAALLVLVLGWTGVLDRAEMWTYDWRMRHSADPSSVHPDIVLVEINDTTIRDLSPLAGRWPWPRVVTSLIISFLNRAPAKVTAVDFTFLEPDRSLGANIGGTVWTAEKSDAALVKAVAESPAIVLLADAVYEGTAGGEQAVTPADWQSRAPQFRLGPAIEERPLVVPPFQDLTDAATALGHNRLALDDDGMARRMSPFIRSGDHYMPSLGVAAALLAMSAKPEDVVLHGRSEIAIMDRRVPLVPVVVPAATGSESTREQLTMMINYRAPSLLEDGRRPYPTYEARHLIQSEAILREGGTPTIDPSTFKNKIVFVGLTASGLVDVFQTSFSRGLMPGIQLHASMADSILSNRFIRPAQPTVRVWSTIAAGLLVALMACLLPWVAAAAGALLLAGGLIWYSLIAFGGGSWLNLAQPLLAVGIALFAGTAYQYFVEGAEKRVVKKLFGRYVSKDVYRQLLENPGLAELGGRRREMSVLFSDIRGFTAVTEKGDPEALVTQLNEYFSRMVAIVFRHHGTVDKFVGDMVMALFSAPVDDERHAEHAVTAAVDMVSALGELNRKWASEGRPQLDIGIGINSGDMIAGNIGSSSIMSYTVIGDNVNLGSRLESLNKEYRTRIIISDATRSRLTGHFEIRPLGDVVVKGKTRPVEIFAVVVPSPVPAVHEAVEQ